MGIVDTLRFWVMNLDPARFEKLMDERRGKGTVSEAVKTVFFSSIPLAVLTALLFILMGLFFGALFGALFALGGKGGALAGAGLGLLYVAMGAVFGLAMVIFTPVLFLIGQAVQWVLAKILGGKGAFSEQAYFSSFIYAGYATVSILSLIPCVGSIVMLIAALLLLYLTFMMLKKVHSLSSLRAAAVIATPILLFIALYIILVLALAIR